MGLLAGDLDGPPPVDPDDARRTAEDILDAPEYAEPTQSVVERALEWLAERLEGFIGTPGGGGPGSVIAWFFIVVLLALAAWLVYRAAKVRGIRKRRPEPALRYGTESHRDVTAWLAEAERLAGEGDHSGALRCRHQALVARLVTDGVVDDVAGRTAGEYRDLAADRLPGEADRLALLTAIFDDVWYGGAAIDAGGYGAFVRDCERVEQAIDTWAGSTGADGQPVGVT